MNTSQKATLVTVKVLRKTFANTFVARLPITSWTYKKLFHGSFKKQDVETHYLGVDLVVPARDVTITPGIIGGYYEKSELEIFKELCKDAHRVLDIGGNIGLYACIAGKAMPGRSKCYSFEPVPENVQYLTSNVSRNKLRNVEIVESAVGDEPGEITLYLSKTHVGTHSASPAINKNPTKVTFPVTTLDQFCAKKKITDKIDIVKIDVEGFDGNVIRGAKEIIAKSRPTIFIEFIPRLLESCGFDLAQLDKLLFKKYKYIFAINEAKGELKEITSTSNASSKDYFNTNLILTNDKKTQALIKKTFAEHR